MAFALLSPSAMADGNCTAPPGTSGLDQYCEALPSPGGSGSSHHGGGGSGGSSKHDQIPPSTVKQLQHSGSAGAAVLALSGSAPAIGSSSQSGSRSSGGSSTAKHHARRHHAQGHAQPAPSSAGAVDTSTHASAPASNPAAAVGSSVSGSLGAGFIGLLAGIAVLLAVFAWFGRRRRPGAEGT